jgi:putative alpha-1,2-mannosidase
MRRSNNWKNLFDNETKWIRPKNHDGSWKDPFDPFEVKVGFVEASAAQSTWYVPHDLPSLAEMMGGSDAAADILNESFETSAKLDFTSGKSHSSELNDAYRKIPINYGNQPSIETAFVFNHIGRPEFTQKWSREIVDKVFGDLSPKFGFSGDEDQGLMGSLSALMKMGLFEMKSGAEMNPKVDIGSPIFDKITIQLNKDYYKGDKIEIVTKNNSKTNMYVQKLSWNNLELSNMEIEHSKLTAGGVLELEMGGTPKMD